MFPECFWDTRHLGALCDIHLLPTQQRSEYPSSSTVEARAVPTGQPQVPKPFGVRDLRLFLSLLAGIASTRRQSLPAVQRCQLSFCVGQQGLPWQDSLKHVQLQQPVPQRQLQQPQPLPRLNRSFASHFWAALLPS